MSNEAQTWSETLAAAVERGAPSVARIDAPGACCSAAATVWSADGLLVAAHHALEPDEGLQVVLAEGHPLPATLVGRDPGTDVAVLRVDASGLPVPAWAGPDTLRVGHLLVALGRPGRSVRATAGIVSALGGDVRTPGGGRLEHYVETDYALRPGFSGGPVLDLAGRAVGLSTDGLLRNSTLVLAVPTLQRVVTELLAHGRIRHGYLGVGVYPVRLPAAVATSAGVRHGLLLLSVEEDGPAGRAGLLLGDVLLSLDSQPLGRPGDLTALLETRIGVEVTLRVLRAGQLQDVKLATGQRA